jgi:hypothetical protein
MPLPQYSQVIIISPNLGEMGAPQCGHLNAVAPKGAMMGAAEAAACFDCAAARLFPHFMQKAASSGSWAPHLGQYKVTQPRYSDLMIILWQFDHLEACI